MALVRLPALSKGRVTAAFAVAIAADILQFPLTMALMGSILSGVGLSLAVPIESVDLAIDIAVGVIEVSLLGFHWMLLPTLFLEAVPGLDLVPTWTACVWWVVRERSRRPPEVPDTIPV
jgi:hypothetical protein